MLKMKLGEGVLTWNGNERRSDRHGSIYLMQNGCTSMSSEAPRAMLDHSFCESLSDKRGNLVAHVIDPRESTHIGDLFRGIFPSMPEIGEDILLGEGVFFIQKFEHEPRFSIGLRPEIPRAEDWLNPKSLYRAHEQFVRLEFHVCEKQHEAGI